MKIKTSAILAILLLLACGGRTTQTGTGQPLKRGPGVSYGGGDGESYETAIVITGARTPARGLDAEYAYISKRYGTQDRDWKVAEQTNTREDDKTYDMVRVRVLKTGEERYLYFDISEFARAPVPRKPSDEGK